MDPINETREKNVTYEIESPDITRGGKAVQLLFVALYELLRMIIRSELSSPL